MSFETYALLTFSQTSAHVKSWILEANIDSDKIITTYFPLFDSNLISILPLSIKFQSHDKQSKLIKNLIQKHAEIGRELMKEYLRTFYSSPS